MITVREQDFPLSIRGFTVLSYDDGEPFYTILINSNLSADKRMDVIRHELSHIEADDFNNDLSVGIIERRTHACI